MKPTLFTNLLLVWCLASTAHATTYYVATTGSDSNPGTQSQPFQTIQKGINTAVNGDTVLVAAGTYTGAGNKNLNLGGKNITLQSQTGPQNCTIDCQASSASPARGFVFESGETAQCVLDGFTVQNGFVTSYGGAMYIDDSSPTIRNCVFTNNVVSGSSIGQAGAVIVRNNAQPTFTGCTFSGNRATGEYAQAGGLQVGVDGTVVLTNTTIQNNIAQATNMRSWGGGLAVLSGTLQMINCTVSGNTARGSNETSGGGLSAQNGGNLLLTNTTLTGNTAQADNGWASGGGADLSSGGQVTLTDCVVSNNTVGASSVASGGGLTCSGGDTVTLNRCTFADNVVTSTRSSSVSRGGGIACQSGSEVTMLHCNIRGNRTVSSNITYGGGVSIRDSETNVTLTSCTLSGNRTESSNLTSEYGGGLAVVEHADTALVNCLLFGNHSDGTGGGVFVEIAEVFLTNCVLVNNYAGEFGGGLYSSRATITATNSIVYNNATATNTAFSGPEMRTNSEGVIIATYSDIKGGLAGTGNINADPRFLDPAAGDIRLQANSPCIRAGTASAPNLPATDFTGIIPRNFGGVDMGAYEYLPANALFVDQATGSDTNPGTFLLPFQTVARALSAAVDPNTLYTIFIKAGNYGSDRPRITGRIRLVNWGNVGQARIGQP